MTASRNRVSRARNVSRRGFTLVEVVFALTFLTIALLSLASLGLATSRMTRGGGTQTVAAARAQARFDSLASLPCQTLAAPGYPTTGAPPTYRAIVEHWAVTAGNNSRNLFDTLWVPGRSKPLVYQSVIPCR